MGDIASLAEVSKMTTFSIAEGPRQAPERVRNLGTVANHPSAYRNQRLEDQSKGAEKATEQAHSPDHPAPTSTPILPLATSPNPSKKQCDFLAEQCDLPVF